ncbi:MAG: tetratricopeptide repeat protein [Anaerolineaceae bacterium]|nr:MAG: tetratricopeptide repeat protein [Anaerolineaceae bacterium]
MGVVYVWQIYIPTVPPLFIPTLTPTRSPASFVLEAESLFQAGKLSQAEESFLQAIAVNPRETTYYIELARIRVFAGNYADAETAARDALVIDPNSALAHAVLAWSVDFQAGQEQDPARKSELLATAMEEIEQAVKINPSSALVHAYYAEILIDNNITDYVRALEEAQRALELDPNLLEAHRALGYVWELTGNRQQALEAYQAAMLINPNLPRLHIDIGNMQRALGNSEGARDSYLNAVALAPTSTEPLSLLVQLYAGIGEFGRASQYAKNAVDLDPTDARLRGNLGRMYYHNNALEEAIVQLELAIRGGPTEDGVWVEGFPLNPADDRVIEFYYTYGLALAKMGRCEEAVPIFEALLRGVPENEVAIYNAQEGLILCGQLERTPTPEIEETPTP